MFSSGTSAEAFALRRTYRRDGTRPAILVCPARGQNAKLQTVQGWIGHVVRRLAEDGFPVLASSLGSTTNFGNAAAATALEALRATAIATYGAADAPVGILATSMGALPGLRYAKAHPADVGAICSAVGLYDLQDFHDVTRTDLAAQIETAHGGAGGYATYLTDENPVDHPEAWDLPHQLHYSSNDDQFTAGIASSFGAAVGAEVVNLGAVGHSPVTVDAGLVADFFAEHLA